MSGIPDPLTRLSFAACVPRLGFWLGRSHGRCVACRRIGPGPSRTAPRGGPRLSRNRGADGGDGAMMRVDAKGNELIVIHETSETQEAA